MKLLFGAHTHTTKKNYTKMCSFSRFPFGIRNFTEIYIFLWLLLGIKDFDRVVASWSLCFEPKT